LCTSTQPSVGLWGNQNLRRVRAESSRRPPRHRCDACSMAWRCRFLTAISQDALVDFHTAVGESTEHSSNASSSSSSMGTAQLPRLSRSHESRSWSVASSVAVAPVRAWRRVRGGATKALVVSNVVATAVSQRILVAVCCAPAMRGSTGRLVRVLISCHRVTRSVRTVRSHSETKTRQGARRTGVSACSFTLWYAQALRIEGSS